MIVNVRKMDVKVGSMLVGGIKFDSFTVWGLRLDCTGANKMAIGLQSCKRDCNRIGD